MKIVEGGWMLLTMRIGPPITPIDGSATTFIGEIGSESFFAELVEQFGVESL